MLALCFSRKSACSGQLLGELYMGRVCAGTHWEGSQYCLGSHSVVALAHPCCYLGHLV